MSLVNYHASYGFDSMKKELFWYDDFEGDSIKDLWRTGTAGDGTIAITDEITGAAFTITLPDASDNAYIDWGNYRTLLVSLDVAIEYRIKCTGGSVDHANWISIYYDNDDYMMFYLQADETVWKVYAKGGGVSNNKDTETAPDSDWHNFRIQSHTHGSTHAHFYYDDEQMYNSPLTTQIPSEYLQPRVYAASNAENAEERTVVVDYCGVRQFR